MSNIDVNRDLELLARTATNIRRHLNDLHSLAWEPQVGDDNDRVRGGTVDHAPRVGDPRARHLHERIVLAAARMALEVIGLERDMTALFVAGTPNPESSRGSLIAVAEHDGLVAKQRQRQAAGEYTPQRLGDQPSHPGRNR